MTDRDQLIHDHERLVPLTVKRAVPKIPGHIDREDLEGAGYLGLVKAAERFEPGRGVKFSTWAISWIRGAVLEYLRADDWVPRTVRDRERRGEPVHIPEVVSLEEALVDDGQGRQLAVAEAIADPRGDVEAIVIAKLERERLRACVRWLPRRERELLVAHYWEEETHRQIGAGVDRSETRVHQWHSESLGRLRRWVERWEVLDGV